MWRFFGGVRAVDGRRSVLFDDIAQLAARTLNGNSALIVMVELATNRIAVVGRYNTFYMPPLKRPTPSLLGPDDHFVAVRDIATDPRMEGHPLRGAIPAFKSLFVARISSQAQMDIGIFFAISVFDVVNESFDSAERLNNFTHVVNVCRQFVSVVTKFDQDLPPALPRIQVESKPVEDRFEEPKPEILTNTPTSRFLFDTLPKKQILHERNGASYVSLRKWQRDIKEHQMSALFATKKTPPNDFIDDVAQEMIACVRKLYGGTTIKTVVPIPGGSSQTYRCLSELIAEHLAMQLHVDCKHVLLNDGAVSKGRSHPLKSAQLKSYSIKEKVEGCVLLVDDVATTGKHLELAQNALRNSGSTCFAMSWIGP